MAPLCDLHAVRAMGDGVSIPADANTPLLIFGLSRSTFHHGALGIARSAGRLGIGVHRVGPERWSPGAFSRYNRGWTTIPADASAERVLEILRERAREIGRAIIVPIDDVASVFVEDHAEELEQHFLFPRQPEGLAQTLSSKQDMYELCCEHGIPTPWSAFPESEGELLELIEQAGFPTVLKCINVGDAPAGAPRVAIVADRAELIAAYRTMESSSAHNVMLQEYVPGTPESVWMFNGYFDAQSTCSFGLTGKKIRQSPPYTGVTTLGVCEPNTTVEETTVRLMKTVSYRGILDIGYRYDDRDGQYKLLDVNPRIGGTFRLFVASNGMDVLRALYLDLTGAEVPGGTPQQGRRWVVDPMDLASSLVYYRRGDITLRSWLRSFRGVREAAWLAFDDPLPFIGLWLALVFDWLPRRIPRRRAKHATDGAPEPAASPR
jgi:predicted ATP-grasp superfamily ATP-dependent carboligase